MRKKYNRGPNFLFQGASLRKYNLSLDLRWPEVNQAKCKKFPVWGNSMWEALETGRDLVDFVNVNSVVSKGASEMRCLRGRQRLDHAQLGCYVNAFAFYTNAKGGKLVWFVLLTEHFSCTENKPRGQQWKWWDPSGGYHRWEMMEAWNKVAEIEGEEND